MSEAAATGISRPAQSIPSSFQRLNEGLGGAYERIAYSRVISRIAQERGCRSLLELNATYIAGIPGFNSCLLAMEGYDVTVTIPERDYADAVHAWELTGLLKGNVRLLRAPPPREKFDLVWNHLAFEQQRDSAQFMRRMARLSNDTVLTLTLAPYNPGYMLHWLSHWWRRKPWDHGRLKQTTIGAMRKAHRAAGLMELESGAADVPPWMDTVDGQIGGTMTYVPWTWCSADPRCQDKALVKFFWHMETHLPQWFKVAVGHHLYVASRLSHDP